MDQKHPPYISYVLRLWPARRSEQVVWRASLVNPSTGERLGFADLERLFTFLVEQTRAGTADETAARSNDAQLTHPVDTHTR